MMASPEAILSILLTAEGLKRDCPTCHAKAGEPCVVAPGSPRHVARHRDPFRRVFVNTWVSSTSEGEAA